jgi:transposase-like protein
MKETGELSQRVRVRSSQYLNNLIEQDHRRVKQRVRPMLGFKRFDNAAVPDVLSTSPPCLAFDLP